MALGDEPEKVGLMAKRKRADALLHSGAAKYGGLVAGIADLLEQARRRAGAVNSILDRDLLGDRPAHCGV